MRKLDFEQIVEVAKPIVKGVACGALLTLLNRSIKLNINVGETESVGYGEAVNTIMNSTMFGSDKSKAVAMLKKCASADYYKAVVCIVSDDCMFASDKLKTIQALSE